ncbi:uncharacterized protein [Chelonus insularis]|uniref:uncharacterized protein n=1 Tax=Chelonus insularis TaxID=460826 RepID=UPI00158D9AD5|nr:uncharacterized protein LOC118065564 [Chelonus insularis]
MSVHFTVNHPICIHRQHTILADREKIKKYERDRRRRLRILQVRQQSNETSRNVLDQTREETRRTLDQLQKDKNSKLAQMHDRKIMEIQQKYEQEMEEIGLAHDAAATQPNFNVISEMRKYENSVAAEKRGKEAIQSLKQAEKPNAAQLKQKRLRQVRKVEDTRSALVSNIPKQINSPKTKFSIHPADSTTSFAEVIRTHDSQRSDDNDIHVIKTYVSPKKRKQTKVISKKTPKKLTVKTNGKISSQVHKPKSQQRVVVEIHQEDVPSVKDDEDQSKQRNQFVVNVDANQDDIEYVICDSDNQHTSNCESKASKCVKSQVSTQKQDSQHLEYNPDDYQQQTSEESICNNRNVCNSNFSLSSSEDSSYFSDTTAVAAVPNNTPVEIRPTTTIKTCRSAANRDGKLNKTVQRKKDHLKGIVQKLNVKDELNAIDKARFITEQEEKKLAHKNKLEEIQKKRGIEAFKRERTKREHEIFFKNLENLTRDERQLRALNIKNRLEQQKLLNLRRKIINNTCNEQEYKCSCCNDEIIIREPIKIPCCKPTDISKAQGRWEKTFDQDDGNFREDIPLSRNEQILDMLKKVERQKILLLKEYGDSLPDEILSASMTSLFNESKSKKAGSSYRQSEPERRRSPEIKVINVSKTSESSDAKKSKLKKKDKKKKADVDTVDKSEIAVQTSQYNQVGEDKSVQVELSDRLEQRSRKSKDSDKLEHVEPVINIITHGEVSSTESFNRPSIVINVGNGTIHNATKHAQQNNLNVLKKTSPRSKARSLPSNSPTKKLSTNTVTSTSAPTSRAGSPIQIQESTDSIESQVEKVPKQLPKRSPKKIKKKSLALKTNDHPSSKNTSTQYSPDIQSASKKSYTVRQQIIYTDNSEASSSYASLSALKPSSILESNSNTSLIQLLCASISDSKRKLADEISPVSTPETPSMRVINMPSNIPHPNRINRILKYSDDKRKREKKTTLLKHEEQRQLFDSHNSSKQSSNGVGCSEPCCTCKNRSYRTINEDIGEIIHRGNRMSEQDSLMINKLDDMQVECIENLNTLDTMLHKVRQDQEPSIMTQTTETSIRTLPTMPYESNVMYLKKCQENIDSMANRILKTYTEFKKIDQNYQLSHDLSPIVETPKLTNPPKNESSLAAKTKPTIIKDEKVNIDIQRFKKQLDSEVLPTTSSSKTDSMVEKLSNEILEQSKKLEKYRPLEEISFEDQTIHHELPLTGRSNSGLVTSSPIDAVEEERMKDIQITKIIKQDNFGHILKDIPKIPLSNGLKNRIEGRRPELSTIEELDTPDTASRSMASVRTPSAKSQKIYVDDNLSKKLVSDNIKNIQNNNVPILSNLGEASIKQSNEKAVQKEFTIKMSDMLNNELVPISGDNYDENDRENNKQLMISLSKNAHGIKSDRFKVDETLKSLDSFLIHCSARNIEIKSDKISSSSSSSFSRFSGISDILSTPTSNTMTSPPEKMEDFLMGLGLAWLIPIARKTREASALTSSSSSDITVAMAKRTKSPIKKPTNNNNPASTLPGFSDVSSISIKEASKSTEKTVLMKGRTSTPNISNFHHTSEKSSIITTSTSGRMSLSDLSDSLIVTNLSLHVKT